MQPNPFLTALKILAFTVLAFMVGLSTCQKGNLEDKVKSLDGNVASLSRSVDELARTVRQGGGVQTSSANRPVEPKPARAAVDAATDPSKPVGTPGRYKDFLSDDPDDPEYPKAAEGHTDGVLGRWFGSEPKGFNFILESDAGLTNYVEAYVSDAPAGRHWRDPSKWKPGVCDRIEVSPDYREYTLFLRKDVVWQVPPVDLQKYPHLAGRHMVTAKDIKFTIDIIRNPQTDCAQLRGYFTDVEDVQVVDDYTLVVRWAKTLHHSISFTLGQGIMPEFVYGVGEDGRPFPPATIGQSFNDHFFNRMGCVGCGPYKFVSYEAGQRIVLERFEDWYGIHDGVRYPLKGMRLLIYPDPVTNLLKIRAGEVEVGALQSPQYKAEILDATDPNSPFKDGRIKNFRLPTAGYLYFGWKNSHVLFKDPVVRKALALACNREEICTKIFLGRYVPMASPVYPESPEADPSLKPLPFDLTAAAALFDQAGWKLDPSTGLRTKEIDGQKKTYEFALLWPGPAQDFEAALNQYRNDLLKIGVKLNPQMMEWAAYQKKLKDREFDACSLLWATNGWEHDFDQIWHSRGIKDPGSSNHIEYSNPEVDKLSDELRSTMDPEKRIEMVRKIGRLLYEDQPYCFFGWRYDFAVYRSYVKNVEQHLYKTRPFLRTLPMWIER